MSLPRRWMRGLGVIISLLALVPWSSAHALTGNYVAPPFRSFYQAHDGMRVLGPALTGLRTIDGYPSQYFEKGRLEDHRQEVTDPAWALMYGRLTVELLESAPQRSVNSTNLTYADLQRATAERLPAPTHFQGGTLAMDGGTFVPYHPHLQAAPGYIVPAYFWNYLNRADLFPGGWLHDAGLPLTNALTAHTVKQGERRTIVLQAFERTILTYDALNPREWTVERGNIGTDTLRADGVMAPAAGPKRIEVDLSEQWLTAYAGDEVVYDEKAVAKNLKGRAAEVLRTAAGELEALDDWTADGITALLDRKVVLARLAQGAGLVVE